MLPIDNWENWRREQFFSAIGFGTPAPHEPSEASLIYQKHRYASGEFADDVDPPAPEEEGVYG